MGLPPMEKRLFPCEQPNITLLHASSMAAEGLHGA